ncbi:MAG: hypothetical protein IPK53_18015 [bacterium]|nr:hypothetical protein [bacterium]
MLTVISTIFLPLTFMAGIWGMNFENMPGTHLALRLSWRVGWDGDSGDRHADLLQAAEVALIPSASILAPPVSHSCFSLPNTPPMAKTSRAPKKVPVSIHDFKFVMPKSLVVSPRRTTGRLHTVMDGREAEQILC